MGRVGGCLSVPPSPSPPSLWLGLKCHFKGAIRIIAVAGVTWWVTVWNEGLLETRDVVREGGGQEALEDLI